MKDTERLEANAPKKPDVRPESLPLTDPALEPKGLGGIFHSLLGRRAKTGTPTGLSRSSAPTLGTATSGTMSLGKSIPGERILSETRKSGPAVIPLPEEEDGEFSVNLLTEELAGRFDPRQKLMQLGFIALGAVVLIGLAIIGLGLFDQTVQSQVEATKSKVQSVQNQITVLKKQQTTIVDTTSKVAAITNLVNHHIRWTKFFDRLEHYTLPSVTYGSAFNGSIGGTVALSARTGSFEEVAQQYLILQQAIGNGDFIKDFQVTGATRVASKTGDYYTFTVTMNLVPSLFDNTVTTAAVTP